MSDHLSSHPAPRSVRAAAGLIIIYGVLAVLHAVLFALGDKNWESLFGAAIRLGGTVMIAGGLVALQRWAWWTAMIAGFLFFMASLLGTVSLLLLRAGDMIEASGFMVLLFCAMTAVLGVALQLLNTRDARLAFGIKS